MIAGLSRTVFTLLILLTLTCFLSLTFLPSYSQTIRKHWTSLSRPSQDAGPGYKVGGTTTLHTASLEPVPVAAIDETIPHAFNPFPTANLAQTIGYTSTQSTLLQSTSSSAPASAWEPSFISSERTVPTIVPSASLVNGSNTTTTEPSSTNVTQSIEQTLEASSTLNISVSPSLAAVPITSSTSNLASTQASSVAHPAVNASTRYVFAFGDSLTATGFQWYGLKPSLGNPFGNPPFPGHSSAIGPNWIDNLITSSPPDTLCYNFATGAAVVNVDIVRPPLSLIPFPHQVKNFTSKLATTPRPDFAPWTAAQSVGIVFLGVNDVAAVQVYTDHATPKQLIDKIMASYFEEITYLRHAGLNRFVLMGVPPLFRFPFAAAPEPYEHFENLTFSCDYWNESLKKHAAAFLDENPWTVADVIPTKPFFDKAIDNWAQYGAKNATCKSRDGKSCLWVDGLHPGIEIAKLLGDGIYQHLTHTGFLS